MITLTESQDKALNLVVIASNTNARLFILWYGGVRAGKTFGAVRAFIEHSLTRTNANYIIAGYVLRSIINNVVPYFRTICDEMDLEYNVVEGGVNPRVEIGTNRFLFYGGDKTGTSKKSQGLTADGLLADEYELLNRDFLKQCEARISKDAALRIYTSNKGQKYSWAKKEYYDRLVAGYIDGVIIDSNPEENTFINDDFWDEKEREFEGNYKERFLRNRFTLDSPSLYDVSYIDFDDDMKLTILGVYSYGNDHFTIPFYLFDRSFVLGEIEEYKAPIKLDIDNDHVLLMINSSAPKLAREMVHNGYNVKGYLDMFAPTKVEMSQRAFANSKVAVLDNAEYTKEVIETYNTPGVGNPAITLIDSVIEYLNRSEQWL